MRFKQWIMAVSAVALMSAACAAETQSFTANIDGAKFAGDDDTIQSGRSPALI